MPIYEYRCISCQHQFEAFQSISDAPKDTCPECQSQVERLISKTVGIAFKGSGFYVNDQKKSASSQ